MNKQKPSKLIGTNQYGLRFRTLYPKAVIGRIRGVAPLITPYMLSEIERLRKSKGSQQVLREKRNNKTIVASFPPRAVKAGAASEASKAHENVGGTTPSATPQFAPHAEIATLEQISAPSIAEIHKPQVVIFKRS